MPLVKPKVVKIVQGVPLRRKNLSNQGSGKQYLKRDRYYTLHIPHYKHILEVNIVVIETHL